MEAVGENDLTRVRSSPCLRGWQRCQLLATLKRQGGQILAMVHVTTAAGPRPHSPKQETRFLGETGFLNVSLASFLLSPLTSIVMVFVDSPGLKVSVPVWAR